MDRGSQPSLTNINGTLFFKANDGIDGRLLWKSDGTANGTVPVGRSVTATGSAFGQPKNASNDPVPGPVVVMNNVAYFAAQSVGHGMELWKSDGTATGTQLVKDIRPGPAGSKPGLGGDRLTEMVTVNNTLYFVANDGTNGYELWKSDGTAAGTVIVKDIVPGSGNSYPSNLRNVNGALFFDTASGPRQIEIWKSDGSPEGTLLLKTFQSGGLGASVNLNGTLFFNADDDVDFQPSAGIWKTDGTPEGTLRVGGPGHGSEFINVGGTLFFVHAKQLWKSNGTAAGTVPVKTSGTPTDARQLTNVNGTLFFVNYENTLGLELWKTDGTDAGTVIVKDIRPDANSFFGPSSLTNVNGTLFFVAYDDVAGPTLWKSDGTAGGTVLVKDINAGFPGSAGLSALTNINGKLFFAGSDGNNGPFGSELWTSDGSAVGTVRVSDIAPGMASASPDSLRALPGGVLFTANDGVHGRELWILASGNARFAARQECYRDSGNSAGCDTGGH